MCLDGFANLLGITLYISEPHKLTIIGNVLDEYTTRYCQKHLRSCISSSVSPTWTPTGNKKLLAPVLNALGVVE